MVFGQPLLQPFHAIAVVLAPGAVRIGARRGVRALVAGKRTKRRPLRPDRNASQTCRLRVNFPLLAHCKRAASAVKPGPKPRATHGRAALRLRKRSIRNRIVAEDMLPYSASTSRDTAVDSGPRRNASSTAVKIFGPPGCTAQVATSASPKPFLASHSTNHGRKLRAISSGTLVASVMSKPWSPIFQVMAYSLSGKMHEPEAVTCQMVPGPSAETPTRAAAPSANRALATIFLGSR